jgi:hypothetical protein
MVRRVVGGRKLALFGLLPLVGLLVARLLRALGPKLAARNGVHLAPVPLHPAIPGGHPRHQEESWHVEAPAASPFYGPPDGD